MKEEIWKEIEGYEDYLISTHGRVKSFKQFKDGKILKLCKDKDGYLQLSLFKNKKKKTYCVHRLVAESFIINTDSEKFNQVNHKDENRTNNYIDNLEWCNCQYNIEYSQAKKYKILFPDGHKETIFNLNKFCKENNLSQSNMYNTIACGCFCKKFKILEMIEKNGTIKKAKETYIKSYRILCPDGNEETTINLTEFSTKNNLDRNCMHRTLIENCFHRGFKILEKLDFNRKEI